MKLQTSVVFLATLSLCSAHIGGAPSLQELNPQFYCGRTLARALAEICSLQDPGLDKRAEATMYGSFFPPYVQQEVSWPWLAPHRARGLAQTRGKRLIDGVVDECCSKPCSIDEMFNYCN